MSEMHPEVKAALKRLFGYIPNEDDGEKWVVFQSRTLIVVHPERRPRLYRQDGGGVYVEIDPLW